MLSLRTLLLQTRDPAKAAHLSSRRILLIWWLLLPMFKTIVWAILRFQLLYHEERKETGFWESAFQISGIFLVALVSIVLAAACVFVVTLLMTTRLRVWSILTVALPIIMNGTTWILLLLYSTFPTNQTLDVAASFCFFFTSVIHCT